MFLEKKKIGWLQKKNGMSVNLYPEKLTIIKT